MAASGISKAHDHALKLGASRGGNRPQWGRGHSTAEIFVATCRRKTTTWLQWGRGLQQGRGKVELGSDVPTRVSYLSETPEELSKEFRVGIKNSGITDSFN